MCVNLYLYKAIKTGFVELLLNKKGLEFYFFLFLSLSLAISIIVLFGPLDCLDEKMRTNKRFLLLDASLESSRPFIFNNIRGIKFFHQILDI